MSPKIVINKNFKIINSIVIFTKIKFDAIHIRALTSNLIVNPFKEPNNNILNTNLKGFLRQGGEGCCCQFHGSMTQS